jgi:hypothetical protein
VNRPDYPVVVLRVQVDTDDVRLLVALTSVQADKLRAGIVCTSYLHGVSIAWGLQVGRAELASTFIDLGSAITWLLERAEGLAMIASLCPGTSTALYSRDRAAFLLVAATLLRRHADRLWLVD